MPLVSKQVTERLKSFFSPRLDHTGFKPPVNLQMGKDMFTEQDNLHSWSQLLRVSQIGISQIVNLYIPWPAGS